jgi:lambda family phage portal protein
MNPLDWAIAQIAPGTGLRRARARAALGVLMNYNAATQTNRGGAWSRARGSDADAAATRRERLAWIGRDMVRNTPFATRAQSVIANNVVADGIIPKVDGGTKKQKAEIMRLVEAHLDTVNIDADGRCNLYGLQRLAMNAIVDSGEVLIRRRLRRRADGLPLMLQLQILEADFLDTAKEGASDAGGYIREGIEYDAIGRRVAYWLYPEHPGARLTFRKGVQWISKRVPASEILHIYRQDRPGQMRGVSWFAPVALALQDLDDHQDAQLMRQKIAACFAAFRTAPDGDPTSSNGMADPLQLTTLTPGRIQTLNPGEDITFASPPGVESYDEFTRSVLRSAASGLGITYEALSGDLSGVNFSSARMGRMEMDRNVSSWQWLMLIPQMMQPIGAWFIEQWALERMQRPSRDLRLSWTPPHRVLIDPTREIAALRDKVRAGFASRQSVIRELGNDPARVLEEQIEDAGLADGAELIFDSDARTAAAGQPAHADPKTGTADTADQNGKDPVNGTE